MKFLYNNILLSRMTQCISDKYKSYLRHCMLKGSPWIALKGKRHSPYVHFQIYNVHYTVSIDGKLQDGSMEIDAGNNLETFKMGSGAEEAIEINDFQNVSIFPTFREFNQASLGDFSNSKRSSISHTYPNGNCFLWPITVPLLHICHTADSLWEKITLFLIFSKWGKQHLGIEKNRLLEPYKFLAERHYFQVPFFSLWRLTYSSYRFNRRAQIAIALAYLRTWERRKYLCWPTGK